MELLLKTARWELFILITSFGVVTLWRLFTSADFTGLLRASDGTLSPARFQMLVLTVLTALQYLLATMQDPSHLPTPPTSLVAVMGGSQLVYLGAKARDLLGFMRK
jgi:hypothetical protein